MNFSFENGTFWRNLLYISGLRRGPTNVAGPGVAYPLLLSTRLSPPGALSPIGEKILRGSELSPTAKSRGPNSNALAFAERALST